MRHISRNTLRQMIDTETDFVLMDARGHEAHAEEHIPGAVSIPSDHVGWHLIGNYKKERTHVI